MPYGNRTQGCNRRQCPPGQDDVINIQPKCECPPSDRWAYCSSNGTYAGCDAIERAQDTETDSTICEHDPGAREGEYGGPAFEQEDEENGGLLGGRGRKEGGKWGEEVCNGEDDGSGFQAKEDTVATGDGWENQELDEHAEDAVKSEKQADTFSLICFVD